MLVRHLDELKAEGGTKVIASGADSVRYIVAADNAGFSVSDVRATGPTEATLHYKHHTEACVVIEGEGTIEDLTTGEVHPLKPGSIYVLYPGERNHLRIPNELRVIAIFNPALLGTETPDADGSYQAPPE